VAFGDSLTAGFGVSVNDAYPARLELLLREQGYGYRVVNAGVSGDTTAGGLRRVDWILKARPRIVILELGANDGLRGLPPERTRDNLARIIERLQAAGATVILAGMRVPPNYGDDYATAFAAIFPDLARRYSLTLIPFFLDGVAADPTLNQGDGIHPNAKGYRVIVERIWPILRPLLARR
jgi:acyl-CoA thioesterase-1